MAKSIQERVIVLERSVKGVYCKIENLDTEGGSGGVGLQGPPGQQGIQGIPGIQGTVGPAGLNWQGSWVSETSYVEDDAVGYDGASWFCIAPTTGTIPPDLDTTHWALLASQGAPGQQGEQGIEGIAGTIIPITASAPLTGGIISTTGTIGISAATNLVDGYITKEAFVTFTNKENSANKQNSLAVDGTGTKFPTVDAVNLGITNSNYWTKTGNDIKNNNTGNTSFGNGVSYVDANGNFYGNYFYPNTIQGGRFINLSQISSSSALIKYNGDYSFTYDDRTLVDRGYVNNRLVVETAVPYSLTNADSGGIVIFTISTTLTVPTVSLADGFECTFVTLADVTLTVVSTGNTLNNAPNPTGSNVLPPKSSFTLKRMIAANTFIATGNL